jgi:hypothetical protein
MTTVKVIKKTPTNYKVPHFNFALYQLWPWISTARIYEGFATCHFTDTIRSKETVLSTVRATTHQQKLEMTVDTRNKH